MFRRRPTPSPAPVAASRARVDASALAEAGWVLPKDLVNGARGRSSALVGTIGSPTVTPVDGAGLVTRGTWSIDWWIGADDRWHLPAREAGARQQRRDETPVVETLLRVPGGDAIQRAYGIRSPREVGDEWVVTEVENATPIPFAVALVIRPFASGALGDVHEITIEKVAGGRGRDGARLVRVDGQPALVLPRSPARYAAGNLASGDVVDTVLSGGAVEEFERVACPDGMATLAMIFPLPHTAILRGVIPVGPGSETGAEVAYPGVVPDAATVASGWDVHRRTPRIEIPDRRASEAFARARTDVLLAHDGESVRASGDGGPDLDRSTAALLGTLDRLDRAAEVDAVIGRWPDRHQPQRAGEDVAVVESIARHWLIHRSDAIRDWVLPEFSAAIERIDRAVRKGRFDHGDLAGAAHQALVLGGRMLAASGQPDAAAAVRELAAQVQAAGEGRPDLGPPPATPLIEAVHTISATLAHLVLEPDDGERLLLVPTLPTTWYGGGIEVHDLPTIHGRLSYAVRWHGTRPAVLWDLVPHDGQGSVVISAPGLDAGWSTTELRGDALLAELPPPEGLDLVQVVAEHPDIDPAMRKPGRAPESRPDSLPDGGSFS